MVNKLPEDFTLHRYEIDVRLVNEDDAEFILSLRTNPQLTRFLHPTDNDLEKQKEWIRKYKKRESEGTDYYFIYSYKGGEFGLNRIYDIHEKSCTGGSWLCTPGTNTEHVVATALISRDIMFEILKLKEDNFDVRKGNHKVLKFHKMMGSVKTSETELDILFQSTPETYFPKRNKIIKLLNLEK